MSLPTHFKMLLDLFVSLDFVVTKLIANHQPVYIERIAEVLKEMNHKKFNETIFRQILTVFPESYFYEFDSTPIKITKYIRDRLKLIPNLSFGPEVDLSPRKSEKCLSVGQIKFRKQCLHERLFKIVKEKHDQFLKEIGIADKYRNSDKYALKWHSKFDLENNVDKIHPVSLDRNFKFLINQTIKRPATKLISPEKVFKNLFQVPLSSSGNIVSKNQHNELIGRTNVTHIINLNISNKSRKSYSTNREHFLKQKLPFHLKTLFELFIRFDKIVHDIYCKSETCFLSKIAPTVSSQSQFSEKHLGKIIAVYHEAYFLKWERLTTIVKSSKLTKKIDITIKPNLRNDCTQSALTSPDKGFLEFDFTQLKERRQKFLERCMELVNSSYRDFLLTKLVSSKDVEDYLQGETWHDEFNIDFHVKFVESVPMPDKPVEKDEIKELKSFAQMFTIMKKKNVFHADAKIYLSYSSNVVKNTCKPLSQSLIEKVKQNKMKKLSSNLEGYPEKNKSISLSTLKDIVAIFENEFRMVEYSPLTQSHLASVICKCLNINENSFNDYLSSLIELVPGWLEKLAWSSPHLSIHNSNLSFYDVSEKLNALLENRNCSKLIAP